MSNVICPEPFGWIDTPILVSSPVAVNAGLFPVAAFAYVNSFTAEPVAVSLNNSAPRRRYYGTYYGSRYMVKNSKFKLSI